MAHTSIDDVIDSYSGNSRRVLEYSRLMGRMVEVAKQPGFTEADWQPLADLVATQTFERVGNFMEVMNWQQYTAFLTAWASTSEWECSFKRVTESDGVVFLELEERSSAAGHQSVVNSLSVYEFDHSGKISHIDVYLQMPLPDPAMLESYRGVDITA